MATCTDVKLWGRTRERSRVLRSQEAISQPSKHIITPSLLSTKFFTWVPFNCILFLSYSNRIHIRHSLTDNYLLTQLRSMIPSLYNDRSSWWLDAKLCSHSNNLTVDYQQSTDLSAWTISTNKQTQNQVKIKLFHPL